MNRNSTVSVVILSHNRPRLLQRGVHRALAQRYADIDVVVVVNGPDSATEKVLAGIDDVLERLVAKVAEMRLEFETADF